ncbi:hypothetical protein [Paraburkholderia bonniea]|uniref:hypothetical protein n=1 Tax=Paraburkholderia bonniea TaxID=2152891 RepID=UPI001291066E|nr:hypothetical protein [Paraburkholderia bonniea]
MSSKPFFGNTVGVNSHNTGIRFEPYPVQGPVVQLPSSGQDPRHLQQGSGVVSRTKNLTRSEPNCRQPPLSSRRSSTEQDTCISSDKTLTKTPYSGSKEICSKAELNGLGYDNSMIDEMAAQYSGRKILRKVLTYHPKFMAMGHTNQTIFQIAVGATGFMN